MIQPRSVNPEFRKGAAAIALTGTAGYVDALFFIALYHVYVANMSGNSVTLGVHLADGRWQTVEHRGLALMSFMAGLVLCGLIIEVAHSIGVRRVISLALGIEAVCLTAVACIASLASLQAEPGYPLASVLAALAAIAMGAQNTTLRSAGALNVYTTHVTGTLTQLSHDIVAYLFWHPEGSRGGFPPPGSPYPSLRSIGFLTCLWVIYVFGAVVAALVWHRWAVKATWLPVLAVLAVIVVDLHRPLVRPPAREVAHDHD